MVDLADFPGMVTVFLKVLGQGNHIRHDFPEMCLKVSYAKLIRP